jgi:hypothetical protein
MISGMQTGTTNQPTASSGGYPHRRDADDFAAEMRARQAAPTADQQQQPELSGTTQTSDDQVIARAQEAAGRLITGAAYQDWITVGRALQIGSAHSMYEAGTNKPQGSRYAACFSRWLAGTKLDKVADKGTRSGLLDLLDRLEDVERWRQTLPANRRLELNHPNTVWRHWQRSTVVRNPNKEKKPSPVAKLKQSLIESQEEVTRLTQADGGNLFTRETSAKDFVRIVRATFTPWKVNEIRKLLMDDESAGKPSKGEIK